MVTKKKIIIHNATQLALLVMKATELEERLSHEFNSHTPSIYRMLSRLTDAQLNNLEKKVAKFSSRFSEDANPRLIMDLETCIAAEQDSRDIRGLPLKDAVKKAFITRKVRHQVMSKMKFKRKAFPPGMGNELAEALLRDPEEGRIKPKKSIVHNADPNPYGGNPNLFNDESEGSPFRGNRDEKGDKV